MESNYIPIHPQVLRIDTQLPFDVFVRIAPGEFNCLFKTGKLYTALIHVKIFKYSIPALFIKESEIDKYFAYVEENIDIVFSDLLISVKSKAKIAHELITKLAQIVLTKPVIETTMRYKKIITLLTDFVFENDTAIRFLITMTSSSFHDYNHQVNVGIYGIGLLKEIIKKSEGHNINEIAAGFFLHDIGLHDVPDHIKLKNTKLNDEEWNLIKKHPERGYLLLKSFGMASDEVKIVLLQHHERYNGAGYPRGLKGDQIHSYSKICAIADTFDALTSHRPYRYAQTSFKALKTMQNEMMQDFDLRLFSKFVLLFSKQKIHEAETGISRKS